MLYIWAWMSKKNLSATCRWLNITGWQSIFGFQCNGQTPYGQSIKHGFLSLKQFYFWCPSYYHQQETKIKTKRWTIITDISVLWVWEQSQIVSFSNMKFYDQLIRDLKNGRKNGVYCYTKWIYKRDMYIF